MYSLKLITMSDGSCTLANPAATPGLTKTGKSVFGITDIPDDVGKATVVRLATFTAFVDFKRFVYPFACLGVGHIVGKELAEK